MAIVQKNLVGIDIGTKNIKIVKVNSKGKVTNCTYVDLPEKIITNGRIESKQMLIETLKLAKKKLGTSFSDCVLCFNCPDGIIRQISIPQMEEQYIFKNVLMELSGFLPMSPDKYVVDYIITDLVETEETKMIHILVYALPSEIVQAYIDCLKAAGFKVKYVDIMENAFEKLFKMFNKNNLTKEQNFGCLYIDNSKASVSLYGNGKFFINKIIDAGVNKVVEDIAEKTGKSDEVVKKLLYTNDVLTFGETFVVEKSIVENYAKDVCFEITRVVEYFKSRNKNTTLGAIYLSGGFSHVKGITNYFEEALGIPVIPVSKYLESDFNISPVKNNGIDYTTAIAITLREESAV